MKRCLQSTNLMEEIMLAYIGARWFFSTAGARTRLVAIAIFGNKKFHKPTSSISYPQIGLVRHLWRDNSNRELSPPTVLIQQCEKFTLLLTVDREKTRLDWSRGFYREKTLIIFLLISFFPKIAEMKLGCQVLILHSGWVGCLWQYFTSVPTNAPAISVLM